MNARAAILNALRGQPEPLAIHQMSLIGISQTAASARLREMRREGLVRSVPVRGKRFTAWKLAPLQEELI